MTPAHSYKAVPSMFIVAPMGSTNDPTLLETPAFCVKQRMVTGSVALDELVANAVARADAMAEKCCLGLMPVNI